MISDRTPNSYYTHYGINTDLSDVIQTGVMVMTPHLHNEILTHVYHTYEEKGGPEWHYEMRPLSYEIIKNKLHFFIDDRFNYLFAYFKLAFYPHLLNVESSLIQKVARKFGFGDSTKDLLRSIEAAYLNSYFLHFAGCNHEMSFFTQKSQRHQDILKLAK